MNFMGNNKRLILVYTEMEHYTDAQTGGVNIMLTPQFYTLKREDLPLKYLHQAKRIAPSLFDGLLEHPENHRYFVAKEGDKWLFIAYDIEKIKSFLTSKGFSLAHISKVYFAEQVRDLFTGPVLLGEKSALVNIDGTMTLVPQSILHPDEKPITFDASFTPSKGIAIEGNNKSFIESTEAYTLAAILSLFAVIYFVEGIRYGSSSTMQTQQMRKLLEKHPSLQSSYKRESIATKYKALDKQERKKREIVKSLSHMIFKGSTLTRLELDNKKFQARFSCNSASVCQKLQQLAKEEKLNFTKVVNSNEIRIEGTL